MLILNHLAGESTLESWRMKLLLDGLTGGTKLLFSWRSTLQGKAKNAGRRYVKGTDEGSTLFDDSRIFEIFSQTTLKAQTTPHYGISGKILTRIESKCIQTFF